MINYINYRFLKYDKIVPRLTLNSQISVSKENKCLYFNNENSQELKYQFSHKNLSIRIQIDDEDNKIHYNFSNKKSKKEIKNFREKENEKAKLENVFFDNCYNDEDYFRSKIHDESQELKLNQKTANLRRTASGKFQKKINFDNLFNTVISFNKPKECLSPVKSISNKINSSTVLQIRKSSSILSKLEEKNKSKNFQPSLK